MNLREMFQHTDCKIFIVTNFYESDKIEDWTVEPTDYQLIPESNHDLWDAYFVVKGFLLKDGNIIDNCFVDLGIPERVSEHCIRFIDNRVVVEYTFVSEFQTIPSVASEQYGDPELYYVKENPQLGIEILLKGKQISNNTSAIEDDLDYIYEEIEQ